MKLPKNLPQKLEEQFCDATENVALACQMIAETSYHKGYLDGAANVLRLMKNGADYDDLVRELKELKTQHAKNL